MKAAPAPAMKKESTSKMMKKSMIPSKDAIVKKITAVRT